MNIYKAIRLNNNISRKEAAELLSISYNTLRNIENNQRVPGRDLIIRMSKLYKCSTDKLLQVC